MAIKHSLEKEISQNLINLQSEIEGICKSAKRNDKVLLVGVSKRVHIEKIEAAYEVGLRHFGENYIQECSEKLKTCAHLAGIQWHFIGHLQSNKIKHLIQPNMHIDSLDNLRHAQIIDRLASEKKIQIPVMLQVNLAGESQKSGCNESEVSELIFEIRKLPSIQLQGLMMIPPSTVDSEMNRPWFRKLKSLAIKHDLKETSMGMSQDYTQAIEEGATQVRIGTSLFGSRSE